MNAQRISLIALVVVALCGVGLAQQPVFVPIKLDGPVHAPDRGSYWYGPFSEACALIDVNGDGKLDVTCGSSWYENPTWRKHEDYRPDATIQGEFVNNCGEAAVDVNGDGKTDLISAGWMKSGVFWYENPGNAGGAWKAHKIIDSEWTEGFIVEDIDGDGDEDIFVNHWARKDGQGVTWLELRPAGRFAAHVLGREGDTHGAGVGDLDGDGRKDLITPEGWWEAPEDRSEGEWVFHPDYRLPEGASIRIIVHDVNEDGRADLIYGRAHDYGLFWLEQLAPEGGSLRFREHVVGEDIHEARQDGQYHTLVLADVNQDGRLDLVTGKRLRGHNDGDASAFDPLFVYWYEIEKGRFIRHVLSYNHLPHYAPTETHNPPPNCAIGTGMSIQVADLNGDGKVDIVVPGKSGLYLFRNRGLPPTKTMR